MAAETPTTTSSMQKPQVTLRRRIRLLDKAQSDLSKLNVTSTSKNDSCSPEIHLGDISGNSSFISDEEDTESGSSGAERGGEEGQARTREETPVGVDEAEGGERTPQPSAVRIGSSRKPRTSAPIASPKAWYEFDLAVVAALVSPIGNWLTGGDYVKNLLLITLLIFYLHQVIEVPWSLYLSARARRRDPERASSPDKDEATARLASSELRVYELSFLALTVLSPVIGAYLLRSVAQAVTGKDVVSWFSTGLFILATGIRPWSHLIDRLNDRVTDLHDMIHYLPSEEDVVDGKEELLKTLQEMQNKMAALERSVGKLRSKLANETEEVYDYVDEAVEAIEKSVKRHEKKWEKQENRVKEVEVAVDGLRGGKGRRQRLAIETTKASAPAPAPSFFHYFIPSWLMISVSKPVSPPCRSVKTSPMASPKYPFRPFNGDRLETIPEETSQDRRPEHWLVTRLILQAMFIALLPLRTLLRLFIPMC